MILPSAGRRSHGAHRCVGWPEGLMFETCCCCCWCKMAGSLTFCTKILSCEEIQQKQAKFEMGEEKLSSIYRCYSLWHFLPQFWPNRSLHYLRWMFQLLDQSAQFKLKVTHKGVKGIIRHFAQCACSLSSS